MIYAMRVDPQRMILVEADSYEGALEATRFRGLHVDPGAGHEAMGTVLVVAVDAAGVWCPPFPREIGDADREDLEFRDRHEGIVSD